jgi:hypothetical protein
MTAFRINLPFASRMINDVFWRAPCEGGVSQWVRIPPGDFAPVGSNRSSHGGNEVAEASDVKGHFR